MREEQLPEGWEWKKLGEITTINPRLTQKNIPDTLPVSFLPMRVVEEISGKYHLSENRTYSEVKKGFTAFQNSDVIFAKITPCMENGKIAVVDDLKNGIGFGSTEFHVFRCSPNLLNHYLFYFLVQTQFRRIAEGNMSGAVGQRRVPKGFLENFTIPLPPLPVQQEIVAVIEELFSELDAGVQELKTALARLKTYRQAVLHHYLNNPDWERVKLGEVSDMCLGKMLDKAKNKGTLQPYLRNINVRWGAFDLDDLLEMRFESHEDERYGVKKGDLIICEGGEPGRAAIWKNETDGIKIQKALHRVRFKPNVEAEFFYYFLQLSSHNGYLAQYFTGTTIKHLTGRELARIKFPLPDLQTQTCIVSEIEERLSEADAMETTIKQELKRAENLRQSILKQAFAGKLVTGDSPLLVVADTPAQTSIPVNQETGQLNLF